MELLDSFSIKYSLIPNDSDWIAYKFKVSILKNDKPVYSTVYHMGIGHAEIINKVGMKQPELEKHIKEAAVSGTSRYTYSRDFKNLIVKAPTPELNDVFYALVMEADAINYTFSEWCSNYGYSDDSIKAKSAYDGCIKSAIFLIQQFTCSEQQQLRDYFYDY